AGVGCGLAVVAAGRITERLLLGATDAAIRTRVDRDVRGAFEVMSRGLQDVARQLAAPHTPHAAARRATKRTPPGYYSILPRPRRSRIRRTSSSRSRLTARGAARSRGPAARRNSPKIGWEGGKSGS